MSHLTLLESLIHKDNLSNPKYKAYLQNGSVDQNTLADWQDGAAPPETKTVKLRHKDSGKKFSSLRTNEAFLWALIDDSPQNAEEHEAAKAISDGLQPMPWKGMVWHAKTDHERVWTGPVHHDLVWTGSDWTVWVAAPAVDKPLSMSAPSKVSASLTGAYRGSAPISIKAEELNQAYAAYEIDREEERDSLWVTIAAFARSRERVGACRKLIMQNPETSLDIDDVFSEFTQKLMDLIDEGKYSHDGRLDRWITFRWNRYFFPEKKQEVGGYLKRIRFTNNLDPSMEGYEFLSHSVNTTKITSNGFDRQSTKGAVSVARVLRELNNPKSPFFKLSDFAKTALTAMSKGESLEQIAERADISARHGRRLLKNAQSDIRRILRDEKNDFSGVLSSIQGTTDSEEYDNVVCITDGEFIGDIQGAAEDVSFEPLLSAKEAAKLLGVHEKTVQALARSGEVPCIRFGKYWRFRASVLDTWVKERLISDHQSRRVS